MTKIIDPEQSAFPVGSSNPYAKGITVRLELAARLMATMRGEGWTEGWDHTPAEKKAEIALAEADALIKAYNIQKEKEVP